MSPDHLTLPVTGLVLLAGVLHATWNAVAKQIDDKLVAFGLIGIGLTAVAAVALPLAGLPRSASIPFALVSVGLHIGYELALMQSYRLGNFGHTYPVARGTAPLLVAAGAWVFAGQHLDGVQLAGVATLAGGLMAVVFAGGRLRAVDLPATIAAVITGVTIAAYTLVDGLGVRHAHNAAGYAALLFLLQGPVLPVLAVLYRRSDPAWRSARSVTAGLTAGVLSYAAYAIVIWAQTRGPLALVSALRETSVISAALIATLVFHEPFGRRRIPSAVAVVAGIVLLSL
jgi:drug/metabolite transporter (DMT)-like permease